METQNPNNKDWHVKCQEDNQASRYFLGIVIIFFGTVYLLRQLGYHIAIPWRKDLIWPIALIFGGLWIFARGKLGSAIVGLLVGLGVLAILLHLLTQGTIWQQFHY